MPGFQEQALPLKLLVILSWLMPFLKHFALKMVGRSYNKSLTKKFENKTWISKTLLWLNGMTELIFLMQNFFCSGHFFAHFFQKWWIKKWPLQKKLVKWKISFFMPINHVQKFMISVHSRIVICPFCIGGSIHLQSPCNMQYAWNEFNKKQSKGEGSLNYFKCIKKKSTTSYVI